MISSMQTDVVESIRRGDISVLKSFLAENPGAVHLRIDGARTLLHVATDWPGHFENVRETIELLVEHGADVNAPFQGGHTETPLHWAASSDDLIAVDTLLDLGADMELPGGVIGAALRSPMRSLSVNGKQRAGLSNAVPVPPFGNRPRWG
jgi:ankyrin repeat protein